MLKKLSDNFPSVHFSITVSFSEATYDVKKNLEIKFHATAKILLVRNIGVGDTLVVESLDRF